MAETRGKKKKVSINLSFPNLTDHPAKSKIFEEPDGVVGLGILAALSGDHQDQIFINCSRDALLAISPKCSSNPIPIFNKKLSAEKMELCEEYTCVTSHVGDNVIKKREYFGSDLLIKNNGSERSSGGGGFWVSSGMVSGSPASYGGETAAADFLDSCFLCQKMLHGLDIFMYRGDKAFCSAECRYKQISIDEHKEFSAGTRNPMEHSVSPCSGTMQFFAGVAAA